MTPTLIHRAALGAVLASITLAGCNRSADTGTAGEAVDRTIAQAEKKASEMKDQASAGMEKAEDQAKAVTQEAREAAGHAADMAGNKVADAVITTEINAALAKDSRLSALKINVDTAEGKVSLSGSAPDVESKSRATQLATAVNGVVSVDNRLTVVPDKM